MVTRMPDVTRLVDRLEDARLVERCRSPEDRREKRRGSILRRRILETVWRDLEEQTSRLMDGVTMDELRVRASATAMRRRTKARAGSAPSPSRRN